MVRRARFGVARETSGEVGCVLMLKGFRVGVCVLLRICRLGSCCVICSPRVSVCCVSNQAESCALRSPRTNVLLRESR